MTDAQRRGALVYLNNLLRACAYSEGKAFEAVLVGEPSGKADIPPQMGALVAFWLAGEAEKEATLRNVMVREEIRLRVYLRAAVGEEARFELEVDAWNAMRNVQAAIRGASTLGGNVTDLEIDTANVVWVDMSGLMYRVVEMTIVLWDTEAEEIAA
jgi:hypothetical protein